MESLRNVGLIGDRNTQTTRLTEMIFIITNGSCKVRSGHNNASVYCTWKDYNVSPYHNFSFFLSFLFTFEFIYTYRFSSILLQINLVNLPLEDEYSRSRALRVIDGAILVLCAFSSVSHNDVDAHTRKNGVPRMIFIENMEKFGADPWRVITEV